MAKIDYRNNILTLCRCWYPQGIYSQGIYIYMCVYLDIQKLHFFWSGLKGSERPKIEQMLILPSVNHIWKDQKYNAKWRRKDAKDQLFDTKSVSLNPSLLAQKWFLGQGLSRYSYTQKDHILHVLSRLNMYICVYMCIYVDINVYMCIYVYISGYMCVYV